MKKLLKNKKGFTLMEMLIVVAIIVILVAVSMPVFTSQLDKSKKAADDANVRAAKAVAVAEYLTNEKTGTFDYDAVSGKLVEENSVATANHYGKVGDNKVVTVTIDTNGNVTTSWKTN